MGLDSSKVKAGLKEATTSIKNFSDTAKNKLGGVAKLATGALVAGFLTATRSAVNYAQELTNLSKVANTSFEDFQALAHGARTVGIENDKLADIFKDTGDKIGDFLQTGGGPMADFFENIAPQVGVTAEQFKNLSGKDALQLYYDSVNKAVDSQEEMTFYMEAIASDASMLIPLLAEGGKAWDNYAKEARKAGLVMDEETREALRKANLEIKKLETQVTIGTGNVIMGFKLMGAGAEGLFHELNNLAGGIGGVFKGTFTLDEEYLQASWDVIFDVFKNGYKRIGNMADEAMGDFFGIDNVKKESIEFEQVGVDAFKGFYKEGSKGAKAVTEADRKRTEEAIKQLEKQRKYEAENSKIREKIAKEQLKQLGMVQTAEETYKDAVDRKVKLEEEYGALSSINNENVIDALGLQPVLLAKKLELEESITAVTKSQIELNKELQEQEQWRIDTAEKNVQLQIDLALASGDVVKAKNLEQQLELERQIQAIMQSTDATRTQALEIAKQQNAIVQARIDDENELALAIAKEDFAEVNRLETKIQKEEFINDLYMRGVASKEEAGRIFDRNLQKAEARKQQELAIIKAQADGNDALAKQLQMRVDKEQEAVDLMKEFKIDIDEATKIAQKLASLRAGPDLNMSGIVTPREQKEFDRQQKIKEKEQKQRLRDEIREERERGGNIRNVSKEKRDTGNVGDRARDAREQRLRRQENAEIQRRRNRGEDMEDIMEDINQRRAGREPKVGGQPPNGKDPGQNGGGDEPKEPEDPAVDTNKKLDEQIGLLEDIKTALQC